MEIFLNFASFIAKRKPARFGQVLYLHFPPQRQSSLRHFLQMRILNVIISSKNKFDGLEFMERRKSRMKKVTNRLTALILSTVFCIVMTGCISKSVQPTDIETSSNEPSLNYSLTYYYCIKSDGYVSEETRQLFESFGKSEYMIPATPVTEMYTEIPVAENNAKGYDPISFVLPEFDLTNYGNTHYWKDYDVGMEIAANYRMVGDRVNGMATDELVKVYIDSAGNIKQYETVNLGKYDSLNLEESKLENLCNMFDSALYEAIGTKLFFQYTSVASSPTNYRVFTDSQDRVVITTTIAIEQDGKIIEADLYAMVS